jgi:peptidoglycan hydrolase-like protein with peptidoglycan-binding domain
LRLAIKKFVLLNALLALCAGYASAAPPSATGGPQAGASAKKASVKTGKHRRHGKRKASWKKKGQQAIKPERATQIQEALIREHYLTGEPSGVWDARTQAALVKFQADHGWQTKVVPDSRALIKLGLGPDYSSENLLNPPPTAAPAAPTSASSRGLNGGADKQ